ncbi:toxin-antitoxin system HicB family antitoxin [Leuconostoc mesenteroides]|uniref:toxin-antitoxin system HicB family antitoxin n=1 Tax=Leuconostoc mesenteroides TaxID=1245 RepID=UPI002361B356|nr:toxin-antitoxin system HicB family antitoxin [Leuconostoc mesenteroides]
MVKEKNMKSGNIPLRIDPKLHEFLAEQASKEGRSLNNYITQLLMANYHPSNFEDRQFVGQVISGKDIDIKSGLVDVSGIYYRYLIDNSAVAKSDEDYVILEANGNILTLRQIMKD